jgi:hypothetical protein
MCVFLCVWLASQVSKAEVTPLQGEVLRQWGVCDRVKLLTEAD